MMGSLSGKMEGVATGLHYSVSKGGLIVMARQLARGSPSEDQRKRRGPILRGPDMLRDLKLEGKKEACQDERDSAPRDTRRCRERRPPPQLGELLLHHRRDNQCCRRPPDGLTGLVARHGCRLQRILQGFPAVGHRPSSGGVRQAGEAGERSGGVLDVGCGTGENAMLFAGLGLEVWGVDAAPLAIEKAKRKATDRGAKVTFEVRTRPPGGDSREV